MIFIEKIVCRIDEPRYNKMNLASLQGMNNIEKLVTILTTNLAIAATDRRGVRDGFTLHSSRNN